MFFRRKKPTEPTPRQETPRPVDRAASSELSADAPTTQFLTGDQQADGQKLAVLFHAIRRVSAAQNESNTLEDLLVDIVDRSIEVTGAERGLLVMESTGGELEVRVARAKDDGALDDLRFSTTIAKRVLEEGSPLKATVQSDTEALELGRSVFDLKLRAVMCVPLEAYDDEGEQAGRPQGVLYVDSRAATRQFKQGDLSLFSALAQNMSIAMRNARLTHERVDSERMRNQLEIAEGIQKHLMPDLPGNQRGFDMHGWYRPAEHAAGDFFDFIDAEGGALGVVVGDVSGHGIGPALITASAQGHLSALMSMVDDLGLVFTKLNRELSKRIEDGRFMTLFVALLHDDGKVSTMNAGHQPAIVWRAATGDCEEVDGGELAIGFSDDHVYENGTDLELAPGDALLAYTDGMTEARDESAETGFIGRDGLARLFSECMREG
ncbi:MAG: GAF domain-containing SpoIIE family protein phosphatase, partial [Planctomycetota bacterium]